MSDWHKQETYKSLIIFGQSAIKFVFLVNSGAIISILTFIGNIIDNKKNINLSTIKISLYFFLAGIVFSGLAVLFAYLTQFKLFNETNNKNNHKPFLVTSVVIIILGILVFILGSLYAIDILIEFNNFKLD